MQIKSDFATKLYSAKVFIHYSILIYIIKKSTEFVGVAKWSLLVFGAMQIVAIFSALHNASHYALYGCKSIDKVIGRVLAASLLTTFTGYQIAHFRHHKELRTKNDPQEVIFNSKYKAIQVLLLMFASLFGAAVWLWMRIPIVGIKSSLRNIVMLELTLGVMLWYLILKYVGDYGIAIFEVVSIAIVLGSLLDIAYHQGLPLAHKYKSLRSIDSDLFGLIFLFGDNRHAEHHLYPSVPGMRLSKLSALERAKLIDRGVSYESGFLIALFKLIFQSPLFLPPGDKNE